MDKDIEAQSPATVKRRKNVGHNLPHNDKRHDKRKKKKKDLRICENERSSPQECSLFLSACRLRGAKKKVFLISTKAREASKEKCEAGSRALGLLNLFSNERIGKAASIPQHTAIVAAATGEGRVLGFEASKVLCR